jgi:hypothetical protein
MANFSWQKPDDRHNRTDQAGPERHKKHLIGECHCGYPVFPLKMENSSGHGKLHWVFCLIGKHA